MKVDYRQVADGGLIGETVFIVDIRHNGNPFDKLLRSVPPTEVLIAPSSVCKGTVYYSECVFLKLKKNGEPSKSVIKLFDNTGYRSHTGMPLNIFTTYNEAVAKYAEQRQKIAADMEDRIAGMHNQLKSFMGVK